MQKFLPSLIACVMLISCGARSGAAQDSDSANIPETGMPAPPEFDADSAFLYLKTQTDFGPRVHGMPGHKACQKWLAAKLQEFGAKVTLQKADLKAADGAVLPAVNIFGQFNPEASPRTLLMAHWDTRPWADNDPDPANHDKPLLGANDGASGVAVLLEIARQIQLDNPGKGIDILFVDAEDRGDHESDDSWALGTQYFVANPVVPGYSPSEVILLDMVGGRNAKFAREMFSQRYSPELMDKVWKSAEAIGATNYFVNSTGGAINDDHIHFLGAGIPAIDIIEYNSASGTGFNPTWHTLSDTPENIDPASLRAAGQTVLHYLRR